MRGRVTSEPERFRVHFLHVTRTDEWDFRKLHAEWLAETLSKSGTPIGFEEFRLYAEPVVARLEPRPLQPLLL